MLLIVVLAVTLEVCNERAICVEFLGHILVGPNSPNIDVFTLQVNFAMLERLRAIRDDDAETAAGYLCPIPPGSRSISRVVGLVVSPLFSVASLEVHFVYHFPWPHDHAKSLLPVRTGLSVTEIVKINR